MHLLWATLMLSAVPRADGQLQPGLVLAPTLDTIAAVSATHVVMAWAAGTVPPTSTLHAGWPRERCLSPESVDQNTNQPLRAYHDFSADVGARDPPPPALPPPCQCNKAAPGGAMLMMQYDLRFGVVF